MVEKGSTIEAPSTIVSESSNTAQSQSGAEQLCVSDGSADSYFLCKGYRYREKANAFDDTPNKSKWQNHVYQHAREAFNRAGYSSVLDIGCGAGFKFMKYFSGERTIGLELQPALSFLLKTYPDRDWRSADVGESDYPAADLYIASDVIEHMRHPDVFLQKISQSPFQKIVLSTPAREILYADGCREYFEPPDNKAHHFEWTMGEFHKFVAQYLKIEEHIYHYNGEYSQILVASPLLR